MNLRRFHVDCLRRIFDVPGVEPALLILDAGAGGSGLFPGEVPSPLWKVFRRLTRPEQGGPFAPADAPPELSGVPQVRCAATQNKDSSEGFSAKDVAAIRAHNPDILLQFGFGDLRGEILDAARYGVWKYAFGSGGPPGLWEILEGNPVTAAFLKRLAGGPERDAVLRSCFLKTLRYSYQQNLANLLNATLDMPAQVCKDILNGVAGYIEEPPVVSRAPVRRTPANRHVALFAFRCAAAWVRNQIYGMMIVDGWNTGLVHAPIEKFLDPAFRPEIKWLRYSKKRMFIADPFLEEAGDNISILAEEFDHDVNRGWIVRVRVDRGRNVEVENILDDKKHLSYPFVLRYEGVTYVIPESSAAREIALYRVDEPDGPLSKVCTLVENFAGLDASIVRHEDRWWMFASDDRGVKDGNLHIWHAGGLHGPWQPHAVNPVKIDVRSSRPAGNPFSFEGALYRPAQNCSLTYGGSMAINRVVRLTPLEFAEEPVREVHPEKDSEYPVGLHTLAAGEGFTLVDGRRDEMHWTLIRRKLLHKLRRAFGLHAAPSTVSPGTRESLDALDR